MFNLYKVFSEASQVTSYVIGSNEENALETFKAEYTFTPRGSRIIIPEDLVVEQIAIEDINYAEETVIVRLANLVEEPKSASLIINN